MVINGERTNTAMQSLINFFMLVRLIARRQKVDEEFIKQRKTELQGKSITETGGVHL